MCDNGGPVGGDLASISEAVIVCIKKVLKNPISSIIIYIFWIGGELAELNDRI
jgi:hypothetical protein